MIGILIAEIACFSFGYVFAYEKQPKKIYISMGTREITSYKAITAECDSTPDIGANGRVAYDGVPIGNFGAVNWLPFGTKFVVPKISGDKVWIVKDRMANLVWSKKLKKWVFIGHRIDLLLHKNARSIGCVKAEVFIVKNIK